MINFAVTLFVLTFTFQALASEREEAIEAFLSSKHVKQAFVAQKAKGNVATDLPEAAQLAGGCGFGGCEYKYIVTVAFTSQGSNNQMYAVAALVHIVPAHMGKARVKVISAEKVLSLGTN